MESFLGESSTSLVELGGQRDNPNVPRGYHFRPLDKELVTDYVKNKNSGLPLPVDIPAVKDLYGCHPKRLQGNGFRDKTDDNDHKEYYFTRRKPKRGSKKKFKRSTPGEGFWKDTSTDLPIEDENKKLIGYKRTLKFFEGNKETTNWIRHEFRDLDECTIDRYILCLIYEKGKKSPTPLTSIPAANKGVTGAVEEVGESFISQKQFMSTSALPYQTNSLLVNTNQFQIQSHESNIQYNPPTDESPGDNEISVSDYDILLPDWSIEESFILNPTQRAPNNSHLVQSPTDESPGDNEISVSDYDILLPDWSIEESFILNPTQSAPNNSHLVQSPELPNINDMLLKGLS